MIKSNYLSPSGVFKANLLLILDQYSKDSSFEGLKNNLEQAVRTSLEKHDLGRSTFELLPVAEVGGSHPITMDRPIVFRAQAENWECLRKISIDYLADQHPTHKSFNIKTNQMETIEEIVNKMRNGQKAAIKFDPLIMKIGADSLFDLKWLKAKTPIGSYSHGFQSFVSAKGDTTVLHSGSCGNLYTQIEGSKKWILFPHQDIHFVPRTRQGDVFRNYKVTPFGDGVSSFSQLKYCRGYDVTLDPGDVLWIPPYMLHSTLNLSDSIGAAYKWLSEWTNFKMAPILTSIDWTSRLSAWLKVGQGSAYDFIKKSL